MWNENHLQLLRHIISGTSKLDEVKILPRPFLDVLRKNRDCFLFKDLLNLPTIRTDDLHRIHNACKFLLLEFANIWPDTESEYPYPSYIDDKELAYRGSRSLFKAGHDDYVKAIKARDNARHKITGRPYIDCLFITAFPTEFLAIVRRMDYFFEGTDPRFTRGFIDNPKNQRELLPPGWVRGIILKRRQAISVAVVCGSKYGPTESALAANQLFSRWYPRHTIVVGVGASLGEDSEFGLGDIAYSTQIDDITLAKNTVNPRDSPDVILSFEVSVTCEPDWTLVPAELRPPVLRFKDNKLFLTGILEERLAPGLQAAFTGQQDRDAIQELAKKSQAKVEMTDFGSNLVERPCPESVIQKAEHVATEGQWQRRIQLTPPAEPGCQRIVPTRVLSGSRVVKAHGVRDYLKKIFPGRLLLEMEGAGVAAFCTKNGMEIPVVIKSACDWATPAKEKSWQPYCADVAASFAVEVALQLG